MSEKRQHWIFDLDGTLTVASHDFDAIRSELALAPGRPILEQLALMPKPEADAIHRRLDEIEHHHARHALAQHGAQELLSTLLDRGARIGIATRNSTAMARVTLEACQLDSYFLPADIKGREAATPKPDPGALLQLMTQWQCRPEQTVMVGDYLFDLQAGRAADCQTVAYRHDGHFEWPSLADYRVTALTEILSLPISP